MNGKFILIALIICIFTTGCHEDEDHENKQKLENELREQRQTADRWMTIAGILGIGCTVLFGAGVAIGSKARKQVSKNE